MNSGSHWGQPTGNGPSPESKAPLDPRPGKGVPLTDEEALLRTGSVSDQIRARLSVTLSPHTSEAMRSFRAARAEEQRLAKVVDQIAEMLKDAAAEHGRAALTSESAQKRLFEAIGKESL